MIAFIYANILAPRLRYTVEEHSGEISGFLVVNILKIQPFKVFVLYAVFALAIKMSTFEVSYLHLYTKLEV